MEDFYKSLSKALYTESEETIPAIKRKSRRRRRCQSIQRQETEITHSTIGIFCLFVAVFIRREGMELVYTEH